MPSRTPVAIVSAEPASARRAYRLLHLTCVLIPAIAGADKFLGRLADWEPYIAPTLLHRLPIDPQTLLLGAGLVELIVAGVTLIAPRLGGVLLTLWLWATAANLIVGGGFYDVALRDLGLSAGSLALVWLAGARRAWTRGGLVPAAAVNAHVPTTPAVRAPAPVTRVPAPPEPRVHEHV